MTVADYNARGHLAFPEITIPNEYSDDRWGGVSFNLDSGVGNIRVTSSFYRDGFRCTGSLSALEAAGMLSPEWRPGVDGNNKSTQSVVYSKIGPILIFGNQRSNPIPFPHLRVIGKSETSLTVEIPATEKQLIFLHEQRKKYVVQREIERAKEQNIEAEQKHTQWRAERKHLSMQKVKLEMLEHLGILDTILNSSIAHTRFAFTEKAHAGLASHLNAIKQLLQKGGSYKLKSSSVCLASHNKDRPIKQVNRRAILRLVSSHQ